MNHVHTYGLPACYRLTDGPCNSCGRAVVQVADIEGLPVYRCPGSCDQKLPSMKPLDPETRARLGPTWDLE